MRIDDRGHDTCGEITLKESGEIEITFVEPDGQEALQLTIPGECFLNVARNLLLMERDGQFDD